MKLLSYFRLIRRVRPGSAARRKRPFALLGLEALEDRSLPSGNTISGYVFLDANNNGLFNPGESPIANSTVQLHNASGVTINSTVTDANGSYAFSVDNTINTSPTTLTRTVSVSATPTDWTRTLTVGQFDPSLGTLTSAEIDNAGSFVSDIKVESLDAAPSTITATDAGMLTLTGPGLSGLVATSSTSQTFHATAFDGVIDFGGTSGHDFGAQSTSGSTSLSLTDAGSLSAYTGTGSVSLTEVAHATSGASGAGNLLAQISTNATAQISVIYHYIPSNSLKPGNYTIVQTSQPPGLLEGLESSNGTVLANSVGSDSIPVTLANTSLANNDFAELQPASLAGFVYVDANNNGIKDAGEAGLAGVTVALSGTNDLGSVTLTTVTASDGSYQFQTLRPGNYTLTKTPPAGFLDGKDTVGSAGGSVGANLFSSINLRAGAAGTNYNFGELQPASLSGFVYLDANNDGSKENGETGISGVTVILSGANGLGTTVNVSQTTGADGSYSFSGLRPGTYTLTEAPPAGYLDGKESLGSGGGTIGTDKFTAITLASGTAGSNYDFAEVLPPNVSGFVYLDLNNNGIKEPGEPGIAGVTITLTGTNDLGAGISQTQTTAADGSYHFLNLRPGTYTITETPPAGYLDGKDTVGTAGGTAANDPQFTGINLGVNITAINYNFAELTPSSLSGFVFLDNNNDGVKEDNESGIAGVTVTLTGTDDRGSAVSIVQTTGSDGGYGFGNLRPGSYAITVTQPAAYLKGKEALGTAGGNVGDDQFFGITLGMGSAGRNYNFAELLPPNATHQIFADSFNTDVTFIKPDFSILSKSQFLSSSGDPSLDPVLKAEATYVDGVYQALLGRHADATGLIAWVQQLQDGVPRAQVVQAIANSTEARGLEVDRLYVTFLHRPADAAGRAFWVNLLVAGTTETDAARMFIASGEYQAAHSDNSLYVAGLYADILGRTASAAEIAGWVQGLQAGVSRDAVAAAFLTSGEAYLRLLDDYYVHFLHRGIDAAGQQSWLAQLLGGQQTPRGVSIAILASDEFFAQAATVSMS